MGFHLWYDLDSGLISEYRVRHPKGNHAHLKLGAKKRARAGRLPYFIMERVEAPLVARLTAKGICLEGITLKEIICH